MEDLRNSRNFGKLLTNLYIKDKTAIDDRRRLSMGDKMFWLIYRFQIHMQIYTDSVLV